MSLVSKESEGVNNASARPAAFLRPRYRIREEGAGYRAEVDLPGVEREAVELTIEDGVLELEATRAWSAAGEWKPLTAASEERFGYRLRLALGDDIDAEKVTAVVERGILRLDLPKKEESKPRRIAIS